MTGRRTEFPIFIERERFERRSNDLLDGVPIGARRLIRDAQPWQRPENARTIDPLWILHTLNNQDKHRAINLIAALTRDVQFELPLLGGSKLIVKSARDGVDFGPEIILLQVGPASFDEDGRTSISGTSVLVIRDAEMSRGRQAVEVMETCFDHLRGVIRSLRPFVEPPPPAEIGTGG